MHCERRMARHSAVKMQCLQVDNVFNQDDIPTPRGHGSWLTHTWDNVVETPLTHGAGKSTSPTAGPESSHSSITSTTPYQGTSCLQVDDVPNQDGILTPRGNRWWPTDTWDNVVETPCQGTSWMRIRTPSPEMFYMPRTGAPIPLPIPNLLDAVEVESVARQDEPIPPLPPSLGSVGHPDTCQKSCKYFWKTRGCKDGASCSHCHLCPRNHFIWRGRRGRKQPRNIE